jgi:Lar family restriction alleviation protein
MELRPCPFCGEHKNLKLISNGKKTYWVGCFTCGAEGPTGTKEGAPKVWNRRRELNERNDTSDTAQMSPL